MPVPHELPDEVAAAEPFAAEEECAHAVLLQSSEFPRTPAYAIVARDEEPAVFAKLRQNHLVRRAFRKVVPQVRYVLAERLHAPSQGLAQVLVDQKGHAATLPSNATAAATSSGLRPHQSQAAWMLSPSAW